MSVIKPRRPRFQVSNEVDVRVDEAELGPTFRATIVGIYWQRQGILEYAVEEADGQRTDGYSEDRLSHARVPIQI